MSLINSVIPQTTNDLIGNKNKISQIKKWMVKWKYDDKEKALLLHGVPGIGKTSCIHVVCKEIKFDPLEINMSDNQTTKDIKTLNEYVTCTPLFSTKKKALLMDGMFSSSIVSEIKNLIKISKIPIICITNDISKLSSLKMSCKIINFFPPDPNTLTNFVNKLIKNKKILQMNEKKIKRIVKSSRGDVGNLLNSIDMSMKKCKKDKYLNLNVIDAVDCLINKPNLKDKDKEDLFNIDNHLIPLYIQNIYPKYIKNIDDLADASELTSLSDVFDRKCSDYSSYFNVCVSQMGSTYKGFIQFPVILTKNSKINKCKRILKKINFNYDDLFILYDKYLSKLLDGDIKKEKMEKIIKKLTKLKFDKDDIHYVLENFYKKKIPTNNKRKITSIYKKII